MKKAEITINLLLTSKTNPRLSVYVQIFGTFDLNETPMAPPETKIIAHKNQINVLHGEKMEYRDDVSTRVGTL